MGFVGRRKFVADAAIEVDRDSSVTSVILLKRASGSTVCGKGERGKNVGRDAKEGDPA